MGGGNGFKSTRTGLAATAFFAGTFYAARVAATRARYGTAKAFAPAGKDSLLDRFLPAPEIIQHHGIDISAPAAVVMSAAKEIELFKSPLVRALFRLRVIALGGEPDTGHHPSKLLDLVRSAGWVVLSERAGREIVLGSVTQPWLAMPRFRSIAAAEFAEFCQPGFAKIAWTLRADPIDDWCSTFHTETRVCTTDPESRRRFRNYWAFVEPGVDLIRLSMLRPLKRAAETRHHQRDNHRAWARWLMPS